jgi:hypothetical protein
VPSASEKIVFFIQLITYFAFSVGIIDHSGSANQTKTCADPFVHKITRSIHASHGLAEKKAGSLDAAPATPAMLMSKVWRSGDPQSANGMRSPAQATKTAPNLHKSASSWLVTPRSVICLSTKIA